MKKLKMLEIFFLMMSIISFPILGYSADDELIWNATLQANGQEIGGISLYQVTIGIGPNEQAVPAPPPAPMYSVKMDLISNSDGELLSKEIHSNNSTKKYAWTLSVDPHGNIMPPAIRISNISWNKQDFGFSNCLLRNGLKDMDGGVVVENMNNTSSFAVEGGPEEQFFTIECSY